MMKWAGCGERSCIGCHVEPAEQAPVDFDKLRLTPSLFLLNKGPSAEECDATKAK
jgi:hypothetical protein